MARLEVDGPPELGRRLGEPVLRPERDAQPVVEFGRGGPELDGAAQVRDGVIEFPPVVQGDAQDGVGLGRGGVEVDGPPEARDALRGAAQRQQGVAEVRVGVGVAGGERQRPLVVADGLVEAVLSGEGGPQVAVGEGVVGGQRQHSPVLFDRLVEPALRLQFGPHVQRGDGPHVAHRQHRPVADDEQGGRRRPRPRRLPGPPLPLAALGRLPDRDRPRRREQHQQRRQGVAVAPHHREQHDAGRVGGEHQVERPELPAPAPRQADARDPQGREQAEVPEVAGEPERRRPVGVAELVLGVGHLRPVQGQHRLAPGQTQPVPRPRAHVLQRPARPVARHLPGGQRRADLALGDLRRVPALEPGVAAPRHEGAVGAVGVGVVADVEVRSELGRRQQELAPDGLVPRRRRQEHEGEPEGQGPRPREMPPAGVARQGQPAQQHRREHQGVLARQHEGAQHHSGPQPPPGPAGLGDEPGEEGEEEAQQEQPQGGFLDQAVEEDRRGVDREHRAGDDARLPREEPVRGRRQEGAGGRAQRDLAQPHREQARTEDRVDEPEEVRVQRGLVEGLGAQPVAAGDLHPPRVVALGVAHREVEERGRTELLDVDEPDREGEAEDGEGGPAEPAAGPSAAARTDRTARTGRRRRGSRPGRGAASAAG